VHLAVRRAHQPEGPCACVHWLHHTTRRRPTRGPSASAAKRTTSASLPLTRKLGGVAEHAAGVQHLCIVLVVLVRRLVIEAHRFALHLAAKPLPCGRVRVERVEALEPLPWPSKANTKHVRENAVSICCHVRWRCERRYTHAPSGLHAHVAACWPFLEHSACPYRPCGRARCRAPHRCRPSWARLGPRKTTVRPRPAWPGSCTCRGQKQSHSCRE